MRFAARRDVNDAVITAAIRSAGFVVEDLGLAGQGVPDKLVTRELPDKTQWAAFIEVKSPKGRLRKGQEIWRLVFEPKGMYYIARDPEDTVRWLWEHYAQAFKPEWLR